MSPAPHPLVLIYGNSLFLHVVERRLRGFSDMGVIHINPTHPTAPEQLAALQDGVLIYDQHITDSQEVRTFLEAHPHVPTVGLDAGGKPAVVLSERAYPLPVTQCLARVLALLSERET